MWERHFALTPKACTDGVTVWLGIIWIKHVYKKRPSLNDIYAVCGPGFVEEGWYSKK